jgi:hypothetical protein
MKNSIEKYLQESKVGDLAESWSMDEEDDGYDEFEDELMGGDDDVFDDEDYYDDEDVDEDPFEAADEEEYDELDDELMGGDDDVFDDEDDYADDELDDLASDYDLDESRVITSYAGGTPKKIRVKPMTSAERAARRKWYQKNKAKVKKQRQMRERDPEYKRRELMKRRWQQRESLETRLDSMLEESKDAGAYRINVDAVVADLNRSVRAAKAIHNVCESAEDKKALVKFANRCKQVAEAVNRGDFDEIAAAKLATRAKGVMKSSFRRYQHLLA